MNLTLLKMVLVALAPFGWTTGVRPHATVVALAVAHREPLARVSAGALREVGTAGTGASGACFGTSGGCPYDSLNVGTFAAAPSVGTQPHPDDAYLYSTFGGAYCDGALGTGTFRLDEGCWTGFQATFKVAATD